MPIISHTDRKSPPGRLVVAAIYALLALGGVTMVYPFLIMLTGSLANPFDYERRSALPRHLASREDRFMRMLCGYFPPLHRGAIRQLRQYFPDLPAAWTTWSQIGDDTKGSDAWAKKQLARLDEPAQRQTLETAARDYRDFMAGWDLRETILAYDARHIAPFLRGRYGSLDAFNAAWEVSLDDFTKANAPEWSGEPINQANYVPVDDVRYRDLLAFRQAYRDHRFTPWLREAPAGYLRPAALRTLWEDYVATQAKKSDPALTPAFLAALPFPASVSDPQWGPLWRGFLHAAFPRRHLAIPVDAARRAAFAQFLQARFRTLATMNRLLETAARDWNAVPLTATIPDGPAAKVWMDFVQSQVPVEQWHIRDTLPEAAFQKFALRRHDDLAGLNAAYGTQLRDVRQLAIPFGAALLVTFAGHERAFALDGLTGNYRAAGDYLFHRGRAVRNTILLVALSLLVSLTVNPLAGYALSRFRLRQSEKLIVFCLATMAFPAAVSAIPGFLLLRDLGLLNTFAALVLPGAANGMSIFLLKGFFDSLPKELYEAATIDGAPEWTIFQVISLPLVKPILAVSALNAFIHAYNAWEWAIIVCQDPSMWTIAVWTYQFYQTLGGQPCVVLAAFILNSIPVLLVFLLCQKIILRGIILPQMK